ncbi:hypothetical protein K8R78_05615 [bacterium]|nr:hypothetical protein [bacterium]
MRYLTILLSLLVIAAALASPLPTEPVGDSLVGGGPMTRYYFYDLGRVSDSFSGNFIMIGGRGYTTVNDWLRFGGGGVSSMLSIGGPDDESIDQSMRIVGAILEPYLTISDELTISLPILLGGGGYEFERILDEQGSGNHQVELYQSGFLCVDPFLDIAWKLSHDFHIGLSGGYTFFFHEEDKLTSSGYVGLRVFFGI